LAAISGAEQSAGKVLTAFECPLGAVITDYL
jgi:hypothetical protein